MNKEIQILRRVVPSPDIHKSDDILVLQGRRQTHIFVNSNFGVQKV